ncbi:MAG: ribosomal silencing factor RsfS [Acidimicrobiia bacterium]
MTHPDPVARTRAQVAAEAALAKKGTDVAVLAVGDVLAIIDLFVLVSAANLRQVRTIVEEVERALHEHDGTKPRSVEGLSDATWVLMDYGDIVVHVFLEETRAYYDLDRLWADVAHLPVATPQSAST